MNLYFFLTILLHFQNKLLFRFAYTEFLFLHFTKLSRNRDGQKAHTQKQFSYIFSMCTYLASRV